MSMEEQISELIDKYERETGRNQSEADLRAGYIDQLFFALGWNIYNDPGQPTNYRREGYIRGAGYVDVGLEIAGEPVLMLEAKRFGALPRSAERTYDRTLEEKQLFRYAHRGKKIPYCILTNFERLHVFNADHEVLILSFDNPTEYLDRLDELQRLSPDKVKAGSLQDWERKREIKPIDKEFLTSLQDWRLRLANTIYEHNLGNSALQSNGTFDFGKLMAAVQRILDRLILIRYADDREVLKQYDILHNIVSSYHNLGAYSRHDHLMKGLIELSHSMDSEHNTTLFEAGHLCEQVFIPNEVLASIIKEMNNISFRKFTSDILGNTYETYLGTKLALKNGEIKSEERRDIRKAGGIFYTPTFVVHYIVDNTLGQLLEELESQHGLYAIEKAQEIRVLDPACGSGSFLIYAYQVLANFYRRMNKAIENEQVRLIASGVGADMFERMEQFKHLPKPLDNYPHHILEKQLYGVDIDAEAAEIAAVNLTMQAFADTKQEKLPLILNENIKVGNSLISGADEELKKYFGDNWRDKKRFNWEQEFEDIMANGGFDVVISNPPYLRVSGINEDVDRYIRTHYETVFGHFDYYIAFLERSVKLLKDRGLLGFIVPNKFLVRRYAKRFRSWLLDNATVLKLVDFSAVPVFGDASVYPVVIVLARNAEKAETRPPVSVARMTLGTFTDFLTTGDIPYSDVDQDGFRANKHCTFDISIIGEEEAVFRRIEHGAEPLGTFATVLTGTPAIKLFYKWGDLLAPQESITEDEKALPFINVSNVSRYAISWGEEIRAARKRLSAPYLRFHSEYVGENKWRVFCINPKIVIAGMARRLTAALDKIGYANLSLYAIVNWESKRPYHINYLLGLINSTLLDFWFTRKFGSTRMSGGYITYNGIYLEQLPIRRIDFDNPKDKKIHDDLVTLVDRMLELNKRLAPIRTTPSSERDELLREIKRTDTEIDQKIYKLYGLTEEEKQVIETSLVSKSSSRSRQAKG